MDRHRSQAGLALSQRILLILYIASITAMGPNSYLRWGKIRAIPYRQVIHPARDLGAHFLFRGWTPAAGIPSSAVLVVCLGI